jgi:hypothetical protein
MLNILQQNIFDEGWWEGWGIQWNPNTLTPSNEMLNRDEVLKSSDIPEGTMLHIF